MQTYLLTWNPQRWKWESFNEDVSRVREGLPLETRWSTGNTRRIEPGDRVFMLRQGPHRPGLLGAGVATSHVFVSPHFDEERRLAGDTALFTRVRLDVLLTPGEVLSIAALRDDAVLGALDWRPAASGTSVPEELTATLEAVWEAHLQDVGVDTHPNHARFRRMIEGALETRPRRTERGVVESSTRTVELGHPGGNHGPTKCWVYSRADADIELLFGFYPNFTPDDLLCKVVRRGETPARGDGASIQFNGELSFTTSLSQGLVLQHHGRVTVGSQLAREELLRLIHEAAPREAEALGLDDVSAWPFRLGSAASLDLLLDRLFVYTFVIEQAKRRAREEPALPSLILEAHEAEARGRRAGQGYGADAPTRMAIELRAMKVVTDYFVSEGYDVEDTHADQPFDLRVKRRQDILTVEVKGTQTPGEAILLTRNEVEHARAHYPHVVLAVVSSIVVTRDPSPRAAGGELTLRWAWEPDAHTLIATAYRCELDASVDPSAKRS